MEITLEDYLKNIDRKRSQYKEIGEYIRFINQNNSNKLITFGELLENKEFKDICNDYFYKNDNRIYFILFAITNPNISPKERNEIYYYYSISEKGYYDEFGNGVDILNESSKLNWVVGTVELRKIVIEN